jgi:hypothetical protein
MIERTWPFKRLYEPGPGLLPKFFFVEERWQRGPDGDKLFTYWYVRDATVSIHALHSMVQNHEQRNEAHHKARPLAFQVFQAKNRTQIVEFLRGRNEPVYFMSTIHPHPFINKETVMPAARPGRAEFLARRIEQMEEELQYIEELPAEPRMDGDDATVIWWVARWEGGTHDYTYAAVRAGDGLWYTTGPHTPKGYAWADLIEWIDKEARPVDNAVWVAASWEPEPLP